MVEKFIPPGNGGNILITSRNVELMRITKNSMEVLEMGEGEALSLLSNSAGLNDTCGLAKQLVSKLGSIPLAIDQAGAYMMACRCPLDDYLKLYTKNQDNLMSNPSFRGVSGYGSSAYGTWDISMKEIEARASKEKEYEAIAAESAVTLYKIFAFLHHVDIPEEMFRNAAENYRKRDIEEEKKLGLPLSVTMLDSKTLFLDGKGEWDEMSFREGIQVLQSFSLIRSSGKIYSIHPSVQLWCRNRISQMEIDRQLILITRALLACSIDLDYDVDNYKFCRLLVPHIRRNDDDVEQLKSGLGNVYYDDVYEKFAGLFHQVGSWNDAERLEVHVMQERREKLGPDHAGTLTSMADLAHTYWNQGRWDDAEKLEVEVMDIRKEKLGSYHQDTLTSMVNLAATYRDQGRWDEAEKLEVHVIEACKEKLGSDHQLALSSMANLGSTYRNQGRWSEAERLEVQVLEARKEKLGSDHPKTLMSMANLACTYKDQGRLDEAEKLEEEVLEARKEILGLDHPDTLTSMGNLASTYSNQGRWDQSEQLAIQVIEAKKEKLGADHPSTLTSIANLGLAYSEWGRWDEAEKLEVQVLEVMKEKFGADHPETLISMGNLISTYWKKSKWDDAEKLGTQLMDAMKEKFGSDHPNTLRRMADLAFIYWNMGRWDEAEALLGQTLELVEQSMGSQDPNAISYREILNNFSKYRLSHPSHR